MQTKTNPTKSLRIREKNKGLLLDEIDKALEVAMFYGFTPIKKPSTNRKDLEAIRDPDHQICTVKIDEDLERCHKLDNKICLLRNYSNGNFRTLPQPLMVSFREKVRPQNQNSLLNLSIIGTQNSIAEVLAIKTSLAILSEKNYQNLSIEINSIGDKDSFSKFEKELVNHVRKNSENAPKQLSDLMRRKTDYAVEHYSKGDDPDNFWSGSPKPTNYLNPNSIRHFQEVLDHLERLDIPYNLNHSLIPNKNICHHTVFQIKNSGVLVGLGVRHQNVTKKMAIRKDIPFLTVVLRDGLSSTKKIQTKKIQPKFFLVQFGNKAKIKSLIVIEQLRKVGIPIYHLLTKDKLVGQLSIAEDLNFSYLLIIGEKEAVEDSVVVRNVDTRVQESVPIENLVGYLKKIKV